MGPVMKALWRTGNKVGVWLYRRTDGRLGGRAGGGLPVLLLTVPGRKSGTPHTVPVAYFETGGGYMVIGSAGGQKPEPQWFRNLRAAPVVQVRLRAEEFTADRRILAGAERDELWEQVVMTRAPFFAKYEQKSGRAMPLALLTRRSK